jgi:hypothetical protein
VSFDFHLFWFIFLQNTVYYHSFSVPDSFEDECTAQNKNLCYKLHLHMKQLAVAKAKP